MVEEVKDNEMFDRWKTYDAVVQKPPSIEILLMDVSRVLGRAWCFDNIEEQTARSKEAHCTFFHVYIEYGATDLYYLSLNLASMHL